MDVTDAATIVGFVAVVFGVVFGAVQLVQFRHKQRGNAAIELVHSFQTPEFTGAVRHLWSVPEGETGETLRGRAGFEEAFIPFGTVAETIGVLVYRRVVRLSIVQDLMGGALVLIWGKVRPYVELLRRGQARPSAFEWFQ